MLKQAVFLVGGMGTRLGELTQMTPKPLIVVAGRPFIDYLIDEAARHCFTDIILLAGHLGAQFVARYDGLRRHGAKVEVLMEPRRLGTGGAVKFAFSGLDDVFLLANGDSFFDINLRTLAQPREGELSMALLSGVNGTRYGRVEVGAGHVRAFQPPGTNEARPINAGLYLMSKQVVAEIHDGPSSLEQDHFPGWAAAGRIRANIYNRFFIDMGVPEDLARADREMAARTHRPAVFFDRDGVLNHDHGYVHESSTFDWIDGAAAAIRACNDRGFLVFVVTNQAGVAHGHFPEASIAVLHRWITEQLAQHGAHVDAFEYCPHHPQGKLEAYRRTCSRRKPGPGMILDLMQRWHVDAARSFLIGDKQSDLDAAAAAGIAGIRFEGMGLQRLVETQLAQRS